ncbi:hypothetical protein DY000_02033012 [Brassica cretica]|uniref:Uncharacterized protein n=1 Tax=Brassica cretica TaxID=69181 RepID=A0ABQ7DQ69_BRACR|nr:hypothetical protein DY000_02033012 [Brassica cretica]
MDEEADDEYFRSGEGKQTMFSSDVYRDEMYNPLYLFGHHFPKPNEDEAWLKWKAWMTSANGNTMKFAHAEKGETSGDEQGVIHRGRKELSKVAANYFQDLHASNGTDPTIQLKLDEPRVMAAGECSPRNRGREVDLVWTNCRSRTRVEAVHGIGRRWSADVDCGRAWSAETSQRGRILTGQTADHGRGLEPSAVDAKTISPICLLG